jgi:hypothetical protein
MVIGAYLARVGRGKAAPGGRGPRAAFGRSRLGGVRRASRPGALRAVVHELVELRLVLGFAQALEEGLEGVLLLFEPAQRRLLVGVEGGVARGGEGVAGVTGAAWRRNR